MSSLTKKVNLKLGYFWLLFQIFLNTNIRPKLFIIRDYFRFDILDFRVKFHKRRRHLAYISTNKTAQN